jgi:hypothetical protein
MRRGPNKVEQVRALFTPGTVLECVENTWIPAQDGSRRRVERLGREFADVELLGEEGRPGPYRMIVPHRVRDVLAVDGSEAIYLLGEEPEEMRGHTVRVRVVSGPEEGR